MSIPLLCVPVLNRYDLLDKMLDSINYPIDKILIINNGKEEYVNKNKNLNVIVLKLPSNIGLSSSWNLAIKLYPNEKYWTFASADIRWQEESLKKIKQNSNSDSFCLSRSIRSDGNFNEGVSAAFSIGENIVKVVGLFDENYYPIYYEYIDYNFRIKNKNLESSIKYNIFDVYENDDAQTIKSDKNFFIKNLETEKNNKEYFNKKIKNNDWENKKWSLDIRRKNSWD